jgi:formylglycine-generating enzyme required for sulfatase activity
MQTLTLDLGNQVTLPLLPIPAGSFLMGSPADDKDRGQDELTHPVTITKPFYLGATPVTVAQYAQFEAASGRRRVLPSFEEAADHPVVNVSWLDAHAFCTWLAARSGQLVTLPTEAQWEYACRAGTTTRFSFGTRPIDLLHYGWFVDNSAGATHPVATRKPNPWGLYDMHGNAWEWCSDWYHRNFPARKKDPAGSPTGSLRVLRGGGWYSSALYCRSAMRFWRDPAIRNVYFGFRIAVAPPPEPANAAPQQPSENC